MRLNILMFNFSRDQLVRVSILIAIQMFWYSSRVSSQCSVKSIFPPLSTQIVLVAFC
jgi:hypothetical protein